ncbi:formate/nitrite transporter family protein [Beijerinckia sp. L45]|uniref:formate/nitrite transporter family protein n=1 Tax=Beijerinckia sp. L45 TaxID=1641855 RepID=UPI00131CB286|nr:formate/nitrite transporter family protein [Beijerinckia sp. L45]
MDRQDQTRDDETSPDHNEPDLEHHERHHAGTGPTPPEARVIHEIIREDGEKALKRSVTAMAWSGFGAGLSMGFSFLVMALIRGALPDAPWRGLVAGFGYTIGFLIVVLGRQQLFTESTLTAVLPFLTRKDLKTFLQMIRLWAVVFLANILGTLLFAYLISHDWLFEPQINEALHGIATEALHDTFWPMLIKAMLAGWLIALMVWLIPGAGPSRLFLILIVTYVVAIAHFSHIIAGSVEAAFNVFTGGITVSEYFTRFMVPTLIGNMIGGVSLVGILNHAPIRDELPG